MIWTLFWCVNFRSPWQTTVLYQDGWGWRMGENWGRHSVDPRWRKGTRQLQGRKLKWFPPTDSSFLYLQVSAWREGICAIWYVGSSILIQSVNWTKIFLHFYRYFPTGTGVSSGIASLTAGGQYVASWTPPSLCGWLLGQLWLRPPLRPHKTPGWAEHSLHCTVPWQHQRCGRRVPDKDLSCRSMTIFYVFVSCQHKILLRFCWTPVSSAILIFSCFPFNL